MKHKLYQISLSVALCMYLLPLHAAGVVIVHADNAAELSAKDINRIFLGKQKKFANGEHAIPVMQSDDSNVKQAFYRKILHKSNAQIKAYWAKRIFTGKGSPPKELTTSDLVDSMSTNKEYIGVISDGLVQDRDVRVVAEF